MLSYVRSSLVGWLPKMVRAKMRSIPILLVCSKKRIACPCIRGRRIAAILLTAAHAVRASSPEHARRWSTELFWLSRQMTGADRTAMQKNAIVELVPIDLTGATDCIQAAGHTTTHRRKRGHSSLRSSRALSGALVAVGYALSRKNRRPGRLAGFHRPISLPSHHRDCRGGQSHQAAARSGAFSERFARFPAGSGLRRY